MKKLLCLVSCIFLVACKQKSAIELQKELDERKIELEQQQEAQKQAGRVSVSKISEFKDNLAYDSSRGVYVIKDNQTGQEFIGISGVGISEVGRHSTGKITNSDER